MVLVQVRKSDSLVIVAVGVLKVPFQFAWRIDAKFRVVVGTTCVGVVEEDLFDPLSRSMRQQSALPSGKNVSLCICKALPSSAIFGSQPI